MVTQRTVVPTYGRMRLGKGFLVHLIVWRDFDSRHGRTRTLCGYDLPSNDFVRDIDDFGDCPTCAERYAAMKRAAE